MDVDKMFKLPALPAAAGQKRRMPDAPAPGAPPSSSSTACGITSQRTAKLIRSELLKRYRPNDEEGPAELASQSNGKGKGRAVTVAEEDEEDEMAYAGRTCQIASGLLGDLALRRARRRR